MENVTKKPPIRVAFVQPIISPTRVPWFNELAQYNDIELKVFALRKTMDHRPGWETKNNKNYQVKIVSSLFIKQNKEFKGADGTALAGRIIPIGLSAKLIKYNPDVIIVSNATEIITALPARWIRGAKIILTAEDTQHSYSNTKRHNQILKKVLYRMADAICAHSSLSIEMLKNIGVKNNKISFTPWAVDNERFLKMAKLEKRNETREKLGLKGTTIVTVGALIPRKGIQQLLDAWNIIDPRIRAESTLLIVGDGPNKNQYSDFTQENKLTEVIFTGHVNPKDVASYLGASDIFVFPTLEDVWGLAVNEAMSIGLPILCSCLAGCSNDLVHNGTNGYIFDPLNQNEFHEILNKMLSNPNILTGMGEESKKIINNFTVKKSVYTLVETIRYNAQT